MKTLEVILMSLALTPACSSFVRAQQASAEVRERVLYHNPVVAYSLNVPSFFNDV